MKIAPLAALPLLVLLHLPAEAGESACRSFDACVRRAQRAYTAQDYAAAQRDLEVAHALRPDPNLLHNLGKVHEKQGHPQAAVDFYRRYLSSDASDLTPARRAELERHVADLSPPPPTTPPTPSPEDGQTKGAGSGPAAPPAPMPNSPGPAVPQPSPEDGSRMAGRGRLWAPGWALIGVGLAGMGAGAGLAAVDGRPTCDIEPRETNCPEVLDTLKSGGALLGIGGAALVTGVIFVAVSARGRRPALAIRWPALWAGARVPGASASAGVSSR